MSGSPITGRPRPRVGINLTWLVPGVVGGSEEYTVRLLSGLAGLGEEQGWPRSDDLVLYCRPDLIDAHPALARWPRSIMPVGVVDRLPGPASPAARVVLEQTWLARVAVGVDLLHHAGGVMPLVRRIPSVLTIHDLQPLDLPENFSPLKRHWLGAMIPRSVRAARLVLCPSDFTARRVVDRFGSDPSRVRVVPHGYEPPAPSSPSSSTASPLSLGPGRPVDGDRFILYPAITHPHKAHIDLITAFDRLPERHHDVQLVLTGGVGAAHEAVLDVIGRLGLDRRVHHLGRVPAAALDALYHRAAVVGFPSTYEGFGNPVLEAMAAGAPVVTTTAGALPEVVGDAALLVRPGDPVDLARALTRVLDDPDLAADLAQRGRRRRERFTERAAAQALADAYRGALNRYSPTLPSPPGVDGRLHHREVPT